MGISSIELDKETYESLGIGWCELPLATPLRMPSLGKVVLLAGPNGAGKSRLLRLLPNLMNKHLVGTAREQMASLLSDLQENINTWQARIVDLTAEQADDVKERLVEAQENIRENQSRQASARARLAMTSLVAIEADQIPVVVDFVPKVPDLLSPADVPDSKVRERAAQMLRLGSAAAESASPAYLRNVMRAAYRAKEQTGEDARSAIAAQASLLV